MLALCRYRPCRFFHVRSLVPVEVRDLYERSSFEGVTHDEARRRQTVEEGLDVHTVIGQNLGLDASRTILKSPIAVCDAPEPGEEQPRQRREHAQLVVCEEARFE
jgi:hypothetical protein